MLAVISGFGGSSAVIGRGGAYSNILVLFKLCAVVVLPCNGAWNAQKKLTCGIFADNVAAVVAEELGSVVQACVGAVGEHTGGFHCNADQSVVAKCSCHFDAIL